MILTPELEDEYRKLYGSCQLNTGASTYIDSYITIVAHHKAEYQAIANVVNKDIPWIVIAVIHLMECGLNFNKQLANGDPLTARTVHVPPGLPQAGNPPFTFEEGAAAALKQLHLDTVHNWSLPATLFRLEGYNGYGYRSHKINSPYLWSMTNHYSKGKYVADGKFDANAVSKQIGCAALLKRAEARGIFKLTP